MRLRTHKHWITGLDYWTQLLDRTTGLNLKQKPNMLIQPIR